MDVHFNARKIKYNTLRHICEPITQSSNIKTVNVFINLDDIYHKLHRPGVNEEFQMIGDNAYKQLIMNILNLIAHYRQGFVRLGCKTRVICFYTNVFNGSFRNSLYVREYRKHYFDITRPQNDSYFFINKAFHSVSNLLSAICDRIDGVYAINTMFIEPSVIPIYLATNKLEADWNFIISKDLYDLQYALHERWSFIWPNGDESMIVYDNGIWDFISYKEKMNPKPPVSNFSPKWYPIAYSVIGDRYRNIEKIKRTGWRSLFAYLQQAEEMTRGMSEITSVYTMVQVLRGKHSTEEMIEKNLLTVDIDRQLNRLSEIDRTAIDQQIIDAPDYGNLQELARMYFLRYPINIQFLTDNNPENNGYNRFGKPINPFGNIG